MHGFFITGTDTEVGKTLVTCALLHAARQQGLRAVGMKPIAAGTDSAGHNEDVERLTAASSFVAAAELINPYCFAPPIAPHIAAAESGRAIDLDVIQNAFDQLAAQADLTLVEGAGGFLVPLGENIDTADLAIRLNLPVILVVGLRLGCINHARLTAAAILHSGLNLAGWVANSIDPTMTRREENIAALVARLPAPLLGVLPHQARHDPAAVAHLLRLPLCKYN
ncbi:MAG: dethiobiotin synthase [Rhodocyclaceae bacterium]|nr:dethiobiotin synthase [Rhodocyclaceae bacterium]MDP1956816.1 dethiobiotin synthase [Rhodocyclaceae bacterium]